MNTQRMAILVFVAYLILIGDMTLRWFPQKEPKPNLVPFRSIARDSHVGSDSFLINFVGNLVAFMPIGLLPALIWPHRASALKVAAGAAILSATIEVAQYFSGRRIADVDDVILNAAGALIGYLVHVMIRRWRERPPRGIFGLGNREVRDVRRTTEETRR